MKPARTLFLTYDGLTDPLGQSQILPYLRGQAARGYRVSVVSCEKPASLKKAGGLNQARATIEADGLEWHPLVYHKKPPVLSTIYDVWRMNRTAKALHAQDPFALIHCRSYLPALAGAPLCRTGSRGPRFLFDMRGLWADERIDGNLWPQGSPLYRAIYRYFKSKERQFLQQADGIVSLTHAAKSEIESWFQPSSLRAEITVIPCCCDSQVFDPASIDEVVLEQMRNQLQLQKDEFLLGYLGSLGTWYLLDEMLLFFRRLLEGRPDAKFLLITNDPDKDIFARAESLGLERDRLRVVSLNRSQIPAALSLVTLGVSLIKPAYSKIASSPTKLAEMLSMGIPVVCNSGVGDAAYLHSHYPIGPLLPGFTEADFDQVLSELDSSLSLAREKRRSDTLEFFSLEHAHTQYSKLYDRLTDRPHG